MTIKGPTLTKKGCKNKRKGEIAHFSNLSYAPCGICTSISELDSGLNKILSHST